MKFTKMHGLGNDYIYIDGSREVVAAPAELARRMADRHLGVGGDGLILILPPESPEADCRMEMYNADGSRAQMCGNGIRCVAKYVYDHGIAHREVLRIDTDAGRREVRVISSSAGTAECLEVDMGAPRLMRSALPMVDGGDSTEAAIDVPLEVGSHTFRVTAVSMGNPHLVVRVDDAGRSAARVLAGDVRVSGFSRELSALDLQTWGPRFEEHPWFPERVNTEFVTARSRREIDLRVWERGSGETLACGTGACAAAVAAVLNDWCDPDIVIHLRGGDLRVRWDRRAGDGSVYMAGPAVEVFEGEWPGEE